MIIARMPHCGAVAEARMYSLCADCMQEMDRVLKPHLDAHRADPGRHPLPRVITTGHSLGASLAILAALHVAVNIREYQVDTIDYAKRLLQTYAFAAPRVGNPDLGAFMRSAKLHYMAVQVRNLPDGVPYLPPKGGYVVDVNRMCAALG